MSDELTQFISSLPDLDRIQDENTLISETTALLERYNNLSPETRAQVDAQANNHISNFNKENPNFRPSERAVRVYERAKSNTLRSPAATLKSADEVYKSRYGEEKARTRMGYQSLERQRQLVRFSEIQAEAKRTGKTFSQVADARNGR